MTVITWILLGLAAGVIGSKTMSNAGGSIVLESVLGIIGALVGGFVFQFVGFHGVTGFDVRSLFVAALGAVIVLSGYHALVPRRSTR